VTLGVIPARHGPGSRVDRNQTPWNLQRIATAVSDRHRLDRSMADALSRRFDFDMPRGATGVRSVKGLFQSGPFMSGGCSRPRCVR
jgi:hypothetical protein